MTQFKGTPGPWSFDIGDCGQDFSIPYCDVYQIGGDDGGVEIASIHSGISDARAIAALPELIEAAERLLGEARKHGWTSLYHDDFEPLRTALNKALGEKQ